MIAFILKVMVTIYIAFSIYTGAIVVLADYEKVSSEYAEWLLDVYTKTIGIMMVVAIVLLAISLVVMMWK